MKKQNWILLGIGAAAIVLTATLVRNGRGSRSKTERPPRRAPQLPLNNPGDQSEFITMASGSEMG